MHKVYKDSEKLSKMTIDKDKNTRSSKHPSMTSMRLRTSASASTAFRTSRGQRGLSATPSKHQQSQQHQVAATILQRRERFRVFDEDVDATPRALTHHVYGTLEGRQTAFDTIGLTRTGSSGESFTHAMRPNLASVSSFSSIYTLDEILAAKMRKSDSIVSSTRVSLRGSVKESGAVEEEDDAPLQFHLPRCDSEILGPDDKVTLILKETETFFLFELSQLTEDARTQAGEAAIEANERYKRIMGGTGRKVVDAETQTPQRYTKTRGTFIGREETKNKATFVNNWVMHDTYETEKKSIRDENREVSRFKFPDTKSENVRLDPEDQLAAITEKEEYEDAIRITQRILVLRDYEEAQKKFAGLLRQDPCDPDLKLIYGLDLLWSHENDRSCRRPVSAFRWNPVNSSLLSVGYGAVSKEYRNEGSSEGLVLIWCAKNPTEPDRFYEFDSSVSNLDWSRSRPNLLAVGFHDGIIRIIDVSKKQLTVMRQSERKTSPSYDPHWQVQWWQIGASSTFEPSLEHLYTSNQDGRITYYSTTDEFSSHEINRIHRIEGKIPGVRRANHCLGHDVPISRHPGVLVLCRHPERPSYYLVGTEEGCIHLCSIDHPHMNLDNFLAHDGPIYSLEFSPFCGKLVLTCGADWMVRIWAEGMEEPLLKFGTKMACVEAAAWSPRNSTIFASVVGNEICIWDLRRKTHRPASITKVSSLTAKLQCLEFTQSGEQLVVADDEGRVYVYGIDGMPLPALDQTHALVDAVQKALLTKPELLKRLKKLGPPFDN